MHAACMQGGGVETLRAIPWIFAWTQVRMVLPAWLGIDTALRRLFEDVSAASPSCGTASCAALLAHWDCTGFKALLGSCRLRCSRASFHSSIKLSC